MGRQALTLAFFACIIAWPSAAASEVTLVDELFPGFPPSRAHFGSALAVDDGLFLIGAEGGTAYDDDFLPTVLVLRHMGDEWEYQQALVPAEPLGMDQFGHTLALTAAWLAVGAPGSGRVIMFARTGDAFEESQVLLPSDEAPNFGIQVALNDDTLVVAGANIYLFQLADGIWTEASPSLLPMASFSQIALDGDTLAVGRPNDADSPLGTVHVLARVNGEWIEQAVIPSPSDDDLFGIRVAVRGDRLYASTPNRLYVFDRDGGNWALSGQSDRLGLHGPLVVSGDRVLTGSNEIPGGAFPMFQILADTGSGWRVHAGAPPEYFTADVFAWDGNFAVAGDPYSRSGAGNVWIYSTAGALGGASCSPTADCLSGFCVDGVCCSSACTCGTCACSIAAGAEVDGVCSTTGAGCVSDGDCDDGEPCTADHCLGDGSCERRFICCASNADCDDADECTEDACGADGLCTSTPTGACGGLPAPTAGGASDTAGCDACASGAGRRTGSAASLPSLLLALLLVGRRSRGANGGARKPTRKRRG